MALRKSGVFVQGIRAVLGRTMASQEGQPKKPSWIKQKWYEASYYPQLGLMWDDTLAFDHPFVNEAVARLPHDVREARQFRIIRASTLSAKQSVLPKSEWMTMDQDVRYLQPYIEEIRKENEEKAKLTKYKYAYRSKRDPILERSSSH